MFIVFMQQVDNLREFIKMKNKLNIKLKTTRKRLIEAFHCDGQEKRTDRTIYKNCQTKLK